MVKFEFACFLLQCFKFNCFQFRTKTLHKIWDILRATGEKLEKSLHKNYSLFSHRLIQLLADFRSASNYKIIVII